MCKIPLGILSCQRTALRVLICYTHIFRASSISISYLLIERQIRSWLYIPHAVTSYAIHIGDKVLSYSSILPSILWSNFSTVVLFSPSDFTPPYFLGWKVLAIEIRWMVSSAWYIVSGSIGKAKSPVMIAMMDFPLSGFLLARCG